METPAKIDDFAQRQQQQQQPDRRHCPSSDQEDWNRVSNPRALEKIGVLLKDEFHTILLKNGTKIYHGTNKSIFGTDQSSSFFPNALSYFGPCKIRAQSYGEYVHSFKLKKDLKLLDFRFRYHEGEKEKNDGNEYYYTDKFDVIKGKLTELAEDDTSLQMEKEKKMTYGELDGWFSQFFPQWDGWLADEPNDVSRHQVGDLLCDSHFIMSELLLIYPSLEDVLKYLGTNKSPEGGGSSKKSVNGKNHDFVAWEYLQKAAKGDKREITEELKKKYYKEKWSNYDIQNKRRKIGSELFPDICERYDEQEQEQEEELSEEDFDSDSDSDYYLENEQELRDEDGYNTDDIQEFKKVMKVNRDFGPGFFARIAVKQWEAYKRKRKII